MTHSMTLINFICKRESMPIKLELEDEIQEEKIPDLPPEYSNWWHDVNVPEIDPDDPVAPI